MGRRMFRVSTGRLMSLEERAAARGRATLVAKRERQRPALQTMSRAFVAVKLGERWHLPTWTDVLTRTRHNTQKNKTRTPDAGLQYRGTDSAKNFGRVPLLARPYKKTSPRPHFAEPSSSFSVE